MITCADNVAAVVVVNIGGDVIGSGGGVNGFCIDEKTVCWVAFELDGDIGGDVIGSGSGRIGFAIGIDKKTVCWAALETDVDNGVDACVKSEDSLTAAAKMLSVVVFVVSVFVLLYVLLALKI